MSNKNTRHKKLREIIQKNAIVTKEKRAIVTPNGNEGNWLFDFRNILLHPEYITLIAEIFWDTFEKKYPFQVGGLETASIPLITAIVMEGHRKKKPVHGFFIRKSRKKTGLQKIIEGKINDHAIILVDDLINSGGTFLRQLAVLDKLDKKVRHIFTIVHFKDLEKYTFAQERNINIVSLFSLEDFGIEFPSPIPKKVSENDFLLEWRFQSEDPNYFYVVPKSAPAIDTDKIYFGSDSGNFWALNQYDGSVAWKYKVGRHSKGKSIFSSPSLYNDTIYFGSYDGNVYALDAQTGKKKWIFMEADWIGSSPALAPELNLLFIGLEFSLLRKQGGIVALDLNTGEKKWEYVMPELTHCSPAYNYEKNIVAIGSNDYMMYAFNAENGALLWKYKTEGEIKASLVFDEKRGHLIFGSFDGNLYIVDSTSGKLIYTYSTKAGIYSTPLIYKNSVYFASLDKYLYCLNLDTHELCWTFPTNGRIFASPAVIDGKIYIGSNDGKAYEINSETGEEIGFFQASERITNKVAYNPKSERLFVPTFANEIYCLSKKGADIPILN